MVKAVIFDCFGVLVASSYEPFKQKYFANDKDRTTKFTEIEDRSSKGEISLSHAYEGFAELARISYEQTEYELSLNPQNKELLEYIKNNLKTRYKIGMLSNVAKDRTKELFTGGDLALFDDLVLSFQVGLAKPDPKIFIMASERLGIEPEECIFVDDLSKYLVGAELAGMNTVHFTDNQDFFKRLKQLLDNKPKE